MSTEKKALWVVFKMDDPNLSEAAWRERFAGAYAIFRDELHGIIFKSWWTNKEKGEWGAFYLFNSEKDLQEYINSDLWLKTVPAKYGAKPVQTILDPGPILCKKTITDAMTSWISD